MPHTEISACIKQGDLWRVDTIVSGDFKASPAKFVYLIVLEEQNISSLDIAFEGSLKT